MNNFPKFSKIANQQPHISPHQTTSQETASTTTKTQKNNPKSSTRISFQDNPYTFEERHARLSELLEPVVRQASLSEPQYETVYNIYPPLQPLHYRQHFHKDFQDRNIQILTQDNLTLKFEITVKLNSIIHHPLPLAPPNITAQSLPPSFITTEIIYKYDRHTKRQLDISIVRMYVLNILISQTLSFFSFSKPNHKNPSPRTGP